MKVLLYNDSYHNWSYLQGYTGIYVSTNLIMFILQFRPLRRIIKVNVINNINFTDMFNN